MSKFKLDKESIDQVFGESLIDVEHNGSDVSASGSEEIILNFTNGKEILIFVHDEGYIVVEGD